MLILFNTFQLLWKSKEPSCKGTDGKQRKKYQHLLLKDVNNFLIMNFFDSVLWNAMPLAMIEVINQYALAKDVKKSNRCAASNKAKRK